MSDDSASTFSRRQALRICAVAGVSFALGGSAVTALLRTGRLRRVTATETKMGTLVTLVVVHPDGAEARAMITAAFAEMDRLEDILSRHRTGTPVARLNRDGVIREAPTELLEVLRRALEYSSLTGGAFDITMAPVLALYEARFERRNPKPPTAREMEAALSKVGYRGIRIEGSSIRFGKLGMALSLDGIAKGYIVDRTVAFLVEAGAGRVMVNGGGDVASSGGPAPGDRWRIGIQDPRESRGSLGVLSLVGQGVATSGDYARSFTEDRRFHHIIDPRTGRSPRHASGATVITATAMDADALSTAAMVLNPAEAVRLLDGLEGVEGLIVTEEGERQTTRGFGRYVG